MEQVVLQLKRLGKKKIHSIPFLVSKRPDTLRTLIEECVRQEVQGYNQERVAHTLIPFLTPAAIQEQSETGKISFGAIENETPAKMEEALENAFLAFQDGLFVVMVDDTEIKDLDAQLHLNDASVISFIRLTFLAGTYW